MQFISPIGFLALAGLIIPVLIHLWNVKQGKTLKIGSIALLGENATTSAKSLKLTDLLLFVLRCLLLVLIALALAQPHFEKTDKTNQRRGWILIDKAKVKEVYQAQSKAIDSLLDIGYQLRDFNLGFNSFSLKDSVNTIATESKLSYDALLHQLNKELPKGYTAYLFADRRLKNMGGNLPQLNFNLVWKEVNSADTLSTWTTTFLTKVYQAISTPRLTTYNSGAAQDIQAIRIYIEDENGSDSKYVRAALKAISDFTKREIEIVTSFDRADVVFWLSDKIPPIAKIKLNARLFSYQKGVADTTNANLNVHVASPQAISLKRRIALDGERGSTVWSDSYGDPVLIKEANTNHYRFYSRFNPRWTDLVWNEQMVNALIPIVLGDQTAAGFGFEDHELDQRLLDKQQVIQSNKNAPNLLSTTTHQNISYLFWILAFLVLLIERILSLKTKTNLQDVKN